MEIYAGELENTEDSEGQSTSSSSSSSKSAVESNTLIGYRFYLGQRVDTKSSWILGDLLYSTVGKPDPLGEKHLEVVKAAYAKLAYDHETAYRKNWFDNFITNMCSGLESTQLDILHLASPHQFSAAEQKTVKDQADLRGFNMGFANTVKEMHALNEALGHYEEAGMGSASSETAFIESGGMGFVATINSNAKTSLLIFTRRPVLAGIPLGKSMTASSE